MIQRDEYLEKLRTYRDKDLIKVVTGVRRCGKSTLFDLFAQELVESGVPDTNIIRINLEDPDFHFSDYMELYRHIEGRLTPDAMNYVFLDEIQNLPQFQKAVDGLYVKKNIDLYITGSNAMLLSGELATLLSGRYIEIKMLPLSLKEYRSALPLDRPLSEVYLQYINRSSFPYALNFESETETDEYLANIYSTILLKDVMARKNFADTSVLEDVAKFMFSNIGSTLSVKKIADTMTSAGRKISSHTVEGYLDALTESFIFYKASRYDVRGKQLLQTGEKYYATDVALRYALLGRRDVDAGHMLENVVYLELVRRGYGVYVGKSEEKEIDFVAENKEGLLYVQVALTVRDEATLERELAPLQALPDSYPKIILSLDEDPKADFNGIKKLNALEWMLDK